MTEHLVKTWDFIEPMEQAQDAAGVEDCLLELARLFGFTSVFGGVVPGPHTSPSEVPSSILIQRMPDESTRRYNGRGYVFRDPIVRQLQFARAPFTWDDACTRCADTGDVRLIRGEAREFGLIHGHVVPIPTSMER
jgi:LuxR family quorum sensing-dependent transcriptional regulator